MAWNNGKERKKFEKEQAELRKIYLANGMTEKEIQAMYDFDLKYLHHRRGEATHTQSLDFDSIEFDDKETDNPLFQKFLEALSTTDDYSAFSRFGWIEEIEDQNVLKAVMELSKDELEIMTMWVFDGMNQREIAERFGVSQQSISKKIKKIKTIFQNRL